MKKIHRLVLKSYLGPLALTFFISDFIFLMQFVWKYIDDLVGKGLEWYTIAELLFYASSTFVPMALPLAVLLSSIMTFGNLGEHYELVAMKSSGISLRRIMQPLIYTALILSGLAFFFSNNVLPLANLKFKSLLYDVRQQKLALNIKEGMFYSGIEDYSIRVGSKDKDGKTIYDVMIFNHADRLGNNNLTTAKSGTMEMTVDQQNLLLTLYDGTDYQEKIDQDNYRRNRPFQITHFSKTSRKFNMQSFALNRTDETFFKSNYMMMNIAQLSYTVDSLEYDYSKRLGDIPSSLQARFYFLSKADSTPALTENKKLAFSPIGNVDKASKNQILTDALTMSQNSRDFLKSYSDDLNSKQLVINKHWIAWHQKFTLSFACLIFFFIGAPLGAIIRKGGLGLPVVISAFLFIIYHIISITGEKSAKLGEMPVYQGMWIASLAMLPLGIFLTRKATIDSPLLDIEVWYKIFSKLGILRFIEAMKHLMKRFRKSRNS